MATQNKRGKLSRLSLWILILLLYTVFITPFLHHRSLEVVHQWQQPATVRYDGGGPYYLSVVKSAPDWRSFPLYVTRSYEIYAGRDSGSPSYGHFLDYSFHAYPDDLETFLSKAQVTWTEPGVELALPSGHRLFIPMAMFAGGR
ncbi:MAG: hypothetical protein IT442_16425 [Phycisphaeraceae bacterium]|nr:hypothetical protein [Phycisphaeraceae bacterium]